MGKKLFFRSLGENIEVRVEIETQKGRLIDVTITAYYLDEYGDEQQFVRWDCSHGQFHKDCLYRKKGGKEHYPKQLSLEDAYKRAMDDLDLNWRDYKSKYMRMKNDPRNIR